MRNIASRARLAILAAPLLVTACTGSGGGTASGQTDALQTSGIAEGYWPPQPLNATQVAPRPANALGGAQSMLLDSARRTIMNNPQSSQVLAITIRPLTANSTAPSALVAPTSSRYGAVVAYSEDLSLFDNCTVAIQ